MKKMSEHLREINKPDLNIYSVMPPMPEKLQLELNETCNHSCVFCPFHSKYMKEKPVYGVMNPEFAKKILEKASELGIGRKELGLFASGEPFLYKNLDEIVSYAKALNFPYIYITTNGSLASPDKAKKVIDAGVDSIRFSVNGDRDTYGEIHGKDDFDTVASNIKWVSDYIKNNNLSINLSISFIKTEVTKSDYEKIRMKFGKYVDEIISFDVEHTDKIGEDVYNKYALKEKAAAEIGSDKLCPIIFNSMYIDSKGNVNLCCSSYWSKISMAELDETIDLEKAWWSNRYSEWRKRMLNNELEETICYKCRLRTVDNLSKD